MWGCWRVHQRIDSERDAKVKVVILTEIISPYRIAPFNYLAQFDGIDLEVLFYAETESRRHWRIQRDKIRFPYRVLRGMQVGHVCGGGPIFLNADVFYRLWKTRPDVLICGGWHHPTSWLALAYAKVRRIRFLVWSESTLRDLRTSSRFRDSIKRWIVRKADGYIVPGSAQKDYLIYLGARDDCIWNAPNAVDTDFFANETEKIRSMKETVEAQIGVKGPIVLYVGRLQDEKGIPDLLAAFERVAQKVEASLVLVGDGPHEKEYRLRCRVRGLKNVCFAGFHDQDSLPLYYGIADVFVFPTHSDPWGLVLNEAMSAALPIICSSAAGGAGDLIEPGGNGFLYPAGDLEQLTEVLYRLLADADLRKRMGEQSRLIVRRYSSQKMAQGFAEAILGLPNTASTSDRRPDRDLVRSRS